jgi:hypothetical protein
MATMNSPKPSWRDHPFKKGETYTAQESFDSFPNCKFVAGQNYVFDSSSYSPYDSSTIFIFYKIGNDQPVDWWWHDEQPESLCLQRFKLSN